MRPEKCKEQPFCKWCGKKIRKFTESTIFYHHKGAPKTREEARRMTNRSIVSVRYSDYPERHVSNFSTWDGETYESAHFCADTTCGVSYAYKMARLVDEQEQPNE